MKPILYYDDRSPPVRSVLMLIDYLNIDCELKFIDLFKGDQLSEGFREINPSHTVPTLKHNNLILTDSHTIMIYLCEKYDTGRILYPLNFDENIKILDKMFFECSILFRRDSDMMSEIIRKGFKNIDIEIHKKKILEAYSILDKNLMHQDYIALDYLTIADFSIVTTLSTVDLLFKITTEKWPHLNLWFDKIKSMKSYKEFNQIGLLKLKDTLEKYGDFKVPIENN